MSTCKECSNFNELPAELQWCKQGISYSAGLLHCTQKGAQQRDPPAHIRVSPDVRP